MYDRIDPPAPPTSTGIVTIQAHFVANSLAELRKQLQEALNEMWPALPVPGTVSEAIANITPTETPFAKAAAEAPAPAAEEKPRRTRRAKEEAPAAPAVDPTSSPSTSAAPTAGDTAPVSPPTERGPTTPAAPAEAPTPSTPPATSSGALSHEAVKKSAEQWMSEHPDGPVVAKKEVRGYLASFGVSRVAELPEASLQDFLDVLAGDV
jgi:hypothetical protein